MATLVGTPFELFYTIFRVNNDSDLCAQFANYSAICVVVAVIFVIFQPFQYGRFLGNNKSSFSVNAKLGWMLLTCMSFICPLGVLLMTPRSQFVNFPNVIATGMYMLHYFHRSFIYPLTMSIKSTPMQLSFVGFGMVTCTFNGTVQGLHLINVMPITASYKVIPASILFLIGMGINSTHDRMLHSLRTNKIQKNPEPCERNQRYKIPRGGLFEYVSGANYLGEIIEWAAWAWLAGGFPQIVFAVFSIGFLATRAVHYHHFYQNIFGDSYPQSRKAIIPFLF